MHRSSQNAFAATAATAHANRVPVVAVRSVEGEHRPLPLLPTFTLGRQVCPAQFLYGIV